MINRFFFSILLLTVPKLLFSLQCDSTFNDKKISTITIDSLMHTAPVIVERELINTIDASFNCSNWEIERQNLLDLDIFSEISLTQESTTEGVALRYAFKELPQYIVLPTIEKTDQDGWRAGGLVASLNFLGRDIRLEAYARYGFRPEFASVAEYMFVISSPYIMNIPLEYEIAYIKTERFNTIEHFNEDSHIIQGEFLYPLRASFNLLFGGHWLYMISDSESIMASGQLNETVNKGFLGISHDTRNVRFNPFKGHYAEARFSQTGTLFGGDLDSREYLFDVRKYVHPATHHLFRMYGLAEYRTGSISRYDFYHGGGVNTLAGYTNTAFAGTSEVLVTAEYAYEAFRHKSFSLWGYNFYLGLQYIAGIDYGVFWEQRKPHSGYSYYTGIHLLVPGAERIRFELSQNLTAFAIDFNIGFFEKSTTRRWRVR